MHFGLATKRIHAYFNVDTQKCGAYWRVKTVLFEGRNKYS